MEVLYPPLREDWSVICSAIRRWPETRMTRNQTLMSAGSPSRRLLRIAVFTVEVLYTL
jgi:hypothetical protein